MNNILKTENCEPGSQKVTCQKQELKKLGPRKPRPQKSKPLKMAPNMFQSF